MNNPNPIPPEEPVANFEKSLGKIPADISHLQQLGTAERIYNKFTTTIIPPSTSSPSTATTTQQQHPTIQHNSFITDCFVFDDYHKKINQVNQLIIENKFLEAIKQLVAYGNREFLKSFRLRSEIIKREEDIDNNNNNTNTITYL